MKSGDKVEHILSKDWLMVLDVFEETIVCRTKDLREIELRKFEVKELK